MAKQRRVQILDSGEAIAPQLPPPGQPAPVEAPEAIASDSMEVTLAPDTGIATFELTDGTKVGVKEPRARQLLAAQSFMETAPPDQAGSIAMNVRMVYCCIAQWFPVGAAGSVVKPDWETFLDGLEIEDIQRVGAALAAFPGLINRLRGLGDAGDSGAGSNG